MSEITEIARHEIAVFERVSLKTAESLCAEIEQQHETLQEWKDEARNHAVEIERLKQEVEAAKWVVQQYFEIAEEAVGEEVIRAKIREREAALAKKELQE